MQTQAAPPLILTMTPTNRTNSSYHPEVTKVNPTLGDYLHSYNSIQIQKHEIDKIKTDDRVKVTESLLFSSQQKLARGTQLIQFILEERLQFLKTFIQKEETLISTIQYFLFLQDSSTFDSIDMKMLSQKINLIKVTLTECYQAFQRINESLYDLDQRFFHTMVWKETLKQVNSLNPLLPELLENTLIDSAQDLYSYFKKKGQLLSKIYDQPVLDPCRKKNPNQSVDKTAIQLSDEQVQKLIEFLETFSVELDTQVPLYVLFLAHLWMDDLIQVSTNYQRNLLFFNGFISSFQSLFDKIYLIFLKAKQNIKQLKCKNQNVQRLLSRIIMPQVQANSNLQILIECQYLLTKSTKEVQKIRKEIMELYEQNPKVKFLRVASDQGDENDKTSGSALKLESYDVIILSKVILNETMILSKLLSDVEMETEGLFRIMSQVKCLVVCEKQMRKGQVIFFRTCSHRQKIILDIKKESDLALKDELQIGMQIYRDQLKLQKYINKIAFYLNTTKEINTFLPLLGGFVQQLEEFLVKSNQLLSKVSIEVGKQNRDIFDELTKRKSLFDVDLEEPKAVITAMNERQSEAEFQKIIEEQGWQERQSNNLEAFDLINRGGYRFSRLEQDDNVLQGGKTLNLLEDLLGSNKRNIKMENFIQEEGEI